MDTETLKAIQEYMDQRAGDWREAAKAAAVRTAKEEVDRSHARDSRGRTYFGIGAGAILAAIFTVAWTMYGNWSQQMIARSENLSEQVVAIAEANARTVAAEVASQTVEDINRQQRSLERIAALQRQTLEQVRNAATTQGEAQATADAIKRELARVETLVGSSADILNALTLLREGANEVADRLATDPEFLDTLVQRVTFPSGMVVASTVACGRLRGGWAEFKPAIGRMIVGAGEVSGTPYQTGISRKVAWSESATEANKEVLGGVEEVRLTEPQMPRHSHEDGTYKYLLRVESVGTIGPHNPDGTAGEPDIYSARALQQSGGSEAHPNMPPYIALYFCEKL